METDSPHFDIYELFNYYNIKYFERKLDAVPVRWSKRMTLCAGTCTYHNTGYCEIALSEPLLKYRPREDVRDTLLHEMIHAYLFKTKRAHLDASAHGPEFQKLMHHINKQEGSRITIYHSFHDEVDYYRVHWWQCNGKCKRIIKRVNNRAPSKHDFWWNEHQSTCGGHFIKIKEPEKKEKIKKQKPVHASKSVMDKFLSKNEKKQTNTNTSIKAETPKQYVDCPVCKKKIEDLYINQHLDECLFRPVNEEELQKKHGQTKSMTPNTIIVIPDEESVTAKHDSFQKMQKALLKRKRQEEELKSKKLKTESTEYYDHPVYGKVPTRFSPLDFPSEKKRCEEDLSSQVLEAFLPSSQKLSINHLSQSSLRQEKESSEDVIVID